MMSALDQAPLMRRIESLEASTRRLAELLSSIDTRSAQIVELLIKIASSSEFTARTVDAMPTCNLCGGRNGRHYARCLNATSGSVG